MPALGSARVELTQAFFGLPEAYHTAFAVGAVDEVVAALEARKLVCRGKVLPRDLRQLVELLGRLVEGLELCQQVLRDRTAAAIIDSSATVPAERGDAATIEEIASVAGIGRATLYRHLATAMSYSTR